MVNEVTLGHFVYKIGERFLTTFGFNRLKVGKTINTQVLGDDTTPFIDKAYISDSYADINSICLRHEGSAISINVSVFENSSKSTDFKQKGILVYFAYSNGGVYLSDEHHNIIKLSSLEANSYKTQNGRGDVYTIKEPFKQSQEYTKPEMKPTPSPIDIMVDIETLSTNVNGKPCLTQIAAIAFERNTGKEVAHFNEYIDTNSCLENGGDMALDTIIWHFENGYKLDPERKQVGILDSLVHFADFVKKNKTGYICANSPRFDLSILRNWLKCVIITDVWKFSDELDIRTIRHQLKAAGVPFDHIYTKTHDALQDCKDQIALLQLWNGTFIK